MRTTLIFFVMVLLLGASATAAQTVTGALIGRVTDSSDAVVAGARVVATETARGVKREAHSNELGVYNISSMDPGVYRVEVQQQGFKTFVADRVEVSINSTVRVDARLSVGAVAEAVEVVADAVQLKTDRGDLSHQVGHIEAENLPLTPDRNYMSLFQLIPGSTEPEMVGSAFGNPASSLANYVNGQNNRTNSYQLDGTINNETNVVSQTAIIPPADAIQVVDVSTNAYDAEHGRATGAVVNVQIKSGTNQLHGSAFAYNVNSELKARNSLSTVDKPHTNMNQFGFTLGGPIRKNRTFFFGDYQGGRDHRGQNTRQSVATAAFRSGDFSGASTRIYDPLTGTSAGANRTQFPGNIIPADRISSVAKNVFAGLPLPNLPGQVSNYDASGIFVQTRDSFDIKVNHKFTDMTEGFIRYSYFSSLSADPPLFGALGGPTSSGGSVAGTGPGRIQSASANLTHVVTPTLVTEFRLGLVRPLTQGDAPRDKDIAAKIGIQGVFLGDFYSVGLPGISISGYAGLGFDWRFPFKIAETSSNFVNNWTKQRGTHAFRFGVDVRDLILNLYQANSSDPRGAFTFNAGVTGTTGSTTNSYNAMAAFVLGLPAAIQRTVVAQVGGYRLKQYYFFAQDRWQATPKLTVNYGLRYEIAPFGAVANPGNQSRYDPATNQIVIAGYGGVDSRANVATDLRNFGPRVGVAYRVTPKTVVRAGYGIGYIPQSINQLSPNSYPAQLTLQVPAANSYQPAGNIATGLPRVPPVDLSKGAISAPVDLVLNVFNPRPRRGYVQSMNLTIERELFGFLVSTSYVGTLGTRMQGNPNINAAGPGSKVTDRPLYKLFGRSADTNLYDYMMSSAYHGWQTRVQRRFKGANTLTVAYTFAKSLDYADGFGISNDIIWDRNRGLSTFDRRHNLVVSHVTPLPIGRRQRFLNSGPAAAIVGGFRFSGVFTARTGTPFDITGQKNTANATQGTANRPDVLRKPEILGGVGSGTRWFDTTVFTDAAPGTWGNAGRNILRGPGYVNYNLTLSRAFRIKEGMRLEMLASAFNLTNSAHYSNPSGSFSSSAFGQISSSYGERQARLGARLQF